MLKKILLKVSKIGNLVIAWFNFCMFFAMRPCWSGISKILGYEDSYSSFIYDLPILLWVVFFAIALATTLMFILMKKEKNLWSYIFNGVNIVFFVAIFVIIALGAADYMDYIWPNFFKYVGIAALILLAVFLIFYYPKTKLANNKIFKISTISALCFLITLNVVNFTFNSITTGAVVYAVEDEYQIVFSSATNARAWVQIGEERYFDNYNGSNRSYTKIHKVSIPMEILDNAKEYEIHVQKITYEGPFGGYFGRDISEKYTFKPVDTSDGFNYYSLSDIHMAGDAAIKAAAYDTDMELLVLAGDIVSMMDTYADANLVNDYAHKITKGSIPVLYARGNHEIKGKYSEEFHKFVGTKGESFFYKVNLPGVYGLVLDMGEDHEDKYWEYYDTAYYNDYRNEQIKFLENELAKGEFSSYDYRLVVCHIPLTFINSRKDHVEPKEKMTNLLNQMDINMMISGHQHDLFVFEPGTVKYNEKGKMVYNPNYTSTKTYGGRMTDHNFLNLLVSKRGYTQTDSSKLTNYSSQIGMQTNVNFAENRQTCIYNNSKGEKVHMIHAFNDEIDYGTEIVFDLTTNKHI